LRCGLCVTCRAEALRSHSRLWIECTLSKTFPAYYAVNGGILFKSLAGGTVTNSVRPCSAVLPTSALLTATQLPKCKQRLGVATHGDQEL
jgi:hypothetical protein